MLEELWSTAYEWLSSSDDCIGCGTIGRGGTKVVGPVSIALADPAGVKALTR